MKTWTIPAIEELEVKLTAKKADPNHLEGTKPGEGHGGPGYEDDGQVTS